LPLAFVVAGLALAGCADSGQGPAAGSGGGHISGISGPGAERCFTQAGLSPARLPLSDTATVIGIDFGSNAVQVYVEPSPQDVLRERSSILAAERQYRSSGAGKVTMHWHDDVLLSWADNPTPAQARAMSGCLGFS
jgi:hypothetical protein